MASRNKPMNSMNSSEKKNDRDYQPMKPDPTSEPPNNVVANPPSDKEIGSSLVRRKENDDED